MTIVTWNCNGALRKKYNELACFDADIIVIQECEDPQHSTDTAYKQWACNYLWLGDNKHKGLGIFCKKGIALVNNDWADNDTKYFISARINDSFNLLAVWCHAKSPEYQYIGQLWKYLQVNKNNLKQAIILGDFNSNSIWDRHGRNWNHSDVVRELEEIGITSLYHQHFDEKHGGELQPTFYLYRNIVRPYHLDYIFASRDLFPKIKSVKVGRAADWLHTSDHLPVIVSI